MDALKMIPYIVLSLCVAGVIAGATAITLSNFGDTMTRCANTSFTINAAGTACTNNTENVSAAGKSDLNLSDQYYTIVQAQDGNNNVAEQFGTVGIIGVLVIIISMLAGVFVYMKYFG